MTKKPLLFIGILLLVFGILIKNLTAFNALGLSLILTGVGLKTFYIVMLGRSGAYTPGRELIILVLGLSLFLTGLYLKRNYHEFGFPVYMIAAGLILKLGFVIAFIRIVKKNRMQGLTESADIDS